MRRLSETRILTYWTRVTIARPWHQVTQASLNGTRNALIEMMRARVGASPTERDGGYLAINTTKILPHLQDLRQSDDRINQVTPAMETIVYEPCFNLFRTRSIT